MCSPTRRHLSSSTSLQQATTATETTAASGGDQLELLHSLFAHAADRMSEPSASDRGSDKPNLCPVEAQPAPDRFQWSFVGLEELARLADGKVGLKQMFGELNQTARWQTEAKLPTKRPGILLCRAANSLGWQTTRPCLTLLAAGTKSGESGARKFLTHSHKTLLSQPVHTEQKKLTNSTSGHQNWRLPIVASGYSARAAAAISIIMTGSKRSSSSGSGSGSSSTAPGATERRSRTK